MRHDETIEEGTRRLERSRGVDLAAFYDRRAAAALGYCSRLCPPEAIGDAVEASFARVFEAAAAAEMVDDETLDARLRSAVRAEAATRTSSASVGMSARKLLERLADPERGGACELMPALLAARADGTLSDGDLQRMEAHLRRCPDCVTAERRFEEAERAFDLLAGDDAPALGRSLLAEMLEDSPLEERRRFTRDEPPEWLEALGWETADRGPETAGLGPEPGPSGETAEWEPDWDAEEAHGAPAAQAAEIPDKRRRLPRLAPRARKRLALTLLVVGLLLSAEAAATVLWKEPITAFLAARSQDDLSDQLEKRAPDEIEADDRARLAEISDVQEREEARMALLAERYDAEVAAGDALGWLTIERLDAEFVVVQSTEADALRAGPGHYVETPLPGEGGTVGVAGHRTTYDAPFRSIDELERGDEITMRMPYGLFTYEVDRQRIVPADYERAFIEAGGSADGGAGPGSVAQGSEWLVLTACHPLYAAQDRILIYAKLVSAEPLGAAVETSEEEEALDAQAIKAAKAERLERMGDRNLGEGMVGDDVKEVQRLLGLPQTGTFGPETTAAVIEFQRTHGLPQVGRVGSQTKTALARRRRPPSRPPTPPAVPPQSTEDEQGTTTPDGEYVPPTPTTPSP